MIRIIFLVFWLNLIGIAHADNSLENLFLIPTLDSNNDKGNLRQEKTPFTSLCNRFDRLISCTIKLSHGAYIYKDSISLTGENSTLKLKPLANVKSRDDGNGKYEYLDRTFKVEAYIEQAKLNDILTLTYRGCDEQGICYPTKKHTLKLTEEFKSEHKPDLPSKHNPDNDFFSEKDSLFFILLLCLLFGMALDFTPCVLPMLSIYSATILGSAYSSFKSKLKQNLGYLAGLSLTYSVLGLIFSEIGISAHAVLQHPVSMIILSGILIIFALDCAGVITLKVPILFNNSLEVVINRQKNGSVAKAFIFGALSALITTPCTSAPLAGALVYVMTTNSILSGVLMFLFIGLGMGLPLILVGIYGSKILSSLKKHTEKIRKLFAIPLLLGAYFISSHLFGKYEQFLTPCILAFCAAYFVAVVFKNHRILVALFFSFVTFGASYLYVAQKIEDNGAKYFTLEKNLNDLEKYTGSPFILTISADWCTNCHVLDNTVYNSESFLQNSSKFKKIRFDFTDPESPDNVKIAEKFAIVGVPFLGIFNEKGELIYTHSGMIDPVKLENDLKNIVSN